MFERYTERARRVIFFARYETSILGSKTIETEHLLLGLLREETNLLQRLLERPDIEADMRARIKARITAGPKISTSVDLPLSDACKRILQYSGEEASRMNHQFIGTEHLLLGILREKGCLAEELLTEAGVSLDAARDAVAKASPPDRPVPAESSPSAEYSSIHALVDRLPADRLVWLKTVIDKLLTGGTVAPVYAESLPTREPEIRQTEERTSTIRREPDGTIVTETRQSIGPNRLSVRERFQVSPDGRKLRYSHEVTGPRPEQRHTQSYEFDVL